MRARVDLLRCDTAGLCVAVCPELFKFRVGDKKAEVTADPIPRALEQRCREIAELCPRGAIVIDASDD